MIKLSALRGCELLKYMKLFNQCTLEEKNKIFFVALKNHLMYLKTINTGLFNKQYESFKKILNDFNSKKYINKIKMENGILITRKSYSSIGQLVDLINEVDKRYHDDYTKSLVINFQLYENGFCPLIFYSFGKWIDLKGINENQTRKIIEFSIMSLYKVVQVDTEDPQDIKLNNKGSVSNIYVSLGENGKKTLWKVPKTIASISFLSEQEYEIYQKLLKTDLKEFIAKDYAYNTEQKVLSHEFIEGEDGEYYLFNNMITTEQKNSLRKFYEVYSSRSCKNIILDIHPGNFVWSSEEKKWVIIDLGAIPEIGSEYYNFKTFEEYYNFIWIQRRAMMRKYPIRSMDFGIDLYIN